MTQVEYFHKKDIIVNDKVLPIIKSFNYDNTLSKLDASKYHRDKKMTFNEMCKDKLALSYFCGSIPYLKTLDLNLKIVFDSKISFEDLINITPTEWENNYIDIINYTDLYTRYREKYSDVFFYNAEYNFKKWTSDSKNNLLYGNICLFNFIHDLSMKDGYVYERALIEYEKIYNISTSHLKANSEESRFIHKERNKFLDDLIDEAIKRTAEITLKRKIEETNKYLYDKTLSERTKGLSTEEASIEKQLFSIEMSYTPERFIKR